MTVRDTNVGDTKIRLETEKRELPNGLTLLAARKSSAPTVAMTCSFELNRLHEPEGKAGLAHMLGQTLDEGTAKHSSEDLAELVEGYGGHLSAGGNGATVQFAVEDVDVAADILAEVVRTPTFPEKELKRAQDLTIAEIQSDLDEPRTVASLAFRKMVYGDHPFGRPAKGDAESVSSLCREDLIGFHRTWCTAGNAVLVAVGDLETARLLDLLEHRFHDWQGTSPAYPEKPYPTDPSESVAQHIQQDKSQVQIFLGHRGIRRMDPDFYKLRVMDHILGSGPGFTSRIARKLRDEQGLCYAVGAGITGSAGREPGLFSAYIGTSPGQEQQAIDGFLAEMKRIREEPCTQQELEDVQAYLTGSFVWSLERNASLAGFLLRVERFGLGEDYLDRLPELIRAVTAQDVMESAHKHLHPDAYYLVTLGP